MSDVPSAFAESWDHDEAEKRIAEHGYDPLDGRLEIIGPFDDGMHQFAVGGYAVPYITGRKLPGDDTAWDIYVWRLGQTRPNLCWDGIQEPELHRWIPLVATAMAAAAGLNAHGYAANPSNPFMCRVHSVTSAERFEDEPS